jgi:hypothetical protein
MTLIVEDGTGVANANSYIDLTFLTAFASARGLTIPTVDATKEQYAILAMDYIESVRFCGSKVDSSQSLQWPRTGVSIDGVDFAEDEIPLRLKDAQCQLVVALQAGILLWPKPITSSSEGVVIEKTVGPLTKKFSANKSKGEIANSRSRIVIAQVEVLLAGLMSCGCASLKILRA